MEKGELRRQLRYSAPAPISHDYVSTEFECGEPMLDEWLKRRALQNESRFSRTFVICEANKIVAFYCLSAGSVERGMGPPKLRRNAPDPIPVAAIGRLAVSQMHSGNGLGRDLLFDALNRLALASRTLGLAAVMVHAKSESAKRFYISSAEFLEFPSDSRILFLPMATIVSSWTEF